MKSCFWVIAITALTVTQTPGCKKATLKEGYVLVDLYKENTSMSSRYSLDGTTWNMGTSPAQMLPGATDLGVGVDRSGAIYLLAAPVEDLTAMWVGLGASDWERLADQPLSGSEIAIAASSSDKWLVVSRTSNNTLSLKVFDSRQQAWIGDDFAPSVDRVIGRPSIAVDRSSLVIAWVQDDEGTGVGDRVKVASGKLNHDGLPENLQIFEIPAQPQGLERPSNILELPDSPYVAAIEGKFKLAFVANENPPGGILWHGVTVMQRDVDAYGGQWTLVSSPHDYDTVTGGGPGGPMLIRLCGLAGHSDGDTIIIVYVERLSAWFVAHLNNHRWANEQPLPFLRPDENHVALASTGTRVP
jgi:hypothetical protein